MTLPAQTRQAIDSSDSYVTQATLGIFPDSRILSGARVELDQGEHGLFLGYVIVSIPSAQMMAIWRPLSRLFILTSAVVLCIAFLSSSFTAHQQVKPLQEMTDVVHRFGMGEYDLRLGEGICKRKDEMGELGTAFNAMADSIALAEQKRSEFVANISHELKTPMTTIAGFADGILDGTIPPEKEREYLKTISDETRRLSRLVRRMLDLSRLQKHDVVLSQTEFDMVEVLAQTLISLEGKVNSKGLDVDARLPDGPVYVWGDPDAITQVCYNLLDNAIKFSHPQTAIGVSLTTRGNKAYISIRDTGETIPPEEIPLIFDRLHKSDRSRSLDKEGVGLGLYLVKTILNDLKETITVTSENHVTEFVFTLTLAR
jgi:signal transduction histidine kinase